MCTHSQGWGAVTHFFPPPLCLAISILVCTVSFFLLFSSFWPHLPLARGGSVALCAIFMPSCTHRTCRKNFFTSFHFFPPGSVQGKFLLGSPRGGPVIFSTNFRAFHLWLAVINFLASCLVHLWKYSPYGCDPFFCDPTPLESPCGRTSGGGSCVLWSSSLRFLLSFPTKSSLEALARLL